MKRTTLISLVLFAALTGAPALASGASKPLKIFVNNALVHAQPAIAKGIVYLPVEPMAQALKMNVSWNPDRRVLKINGKTEKFQALIVNGVLYLPVESAAKSIGALMDWDGARNVIHIRLKAAARSKPSGSQTITTNPEEINKDEEIPPPPQEPQPPPPTDIGGQDSFFVPRTSANNEFSVTVTNVEETHLIKNYYKPREGKKFVVLHLSEQNISDKVQMYSGRFALQDQNQISYDYLDGLSNFYLQILRPGGINFGSLVFEVPEDSEASKLVLRTFENSPMIISLR